MATLETLETEEGNTKTSSARIVPGLKWCFTAFENEMEILETKIVKDPNLKYGFGRETCPTTGKIHSQGFLESTKKIRPKEYFKTKTVHWEKMKGSIKENVAYCSKEGKFTTNVKFRRPVEDPMEGRTLFGWQQEIMEIIWGKADDRKIHVYVDEEGGKGKSSFAKHLVMKHGAISVSGKSADVKCAIVELLKNEDFDLEIVLWDLPRCIGDMVNYQSIEEVKNGLFFSGKYESGMACFNIPHIIIFTNSMPDTEKLSSGRFIIHKI